MSRTKHKKRAIIIFVLTALLLLIIGALFYYLFLPSEKPEIKDMTVVNVIDGDTFEYYDTSTKTIRTVRLLCVNTPEQGEEGYEEAKIFLTELLLGNKVILEKDVSETDKYGRLLRYVYLENGEFVNELIIKNDYGEILKIEPDVKRCDEIANS